jgi:hypothetical protein
MQGPSFLSGDMRSNKPLERLGPAARPRPLNGSVRPREESPMAVKGRLALWRAAAISLLLASFAPAATHANGVQVGFQAGMIFPVGSRSVQLASETVTVRLGEPLEPGYVSCGYALKNLSDSTQAFQMAFVTHGFLYDLDSYEDLEFRVVCLGKVIPVRFAPVDQKRWFPHVGVSADSLPTWELSIAPRDSLQIGMRYRVAWSGDERGHWAFDYVARPAALWAGTIDHARIAFEFTEFTAQLLRCALQTDACLHVKASPESGKWIGDALVWEFRDWEPDQNIGIDVATHEVDGLTRP